MNYNNDLFRALFGLGAAQSNQSNYEQLRRQQNVYGNAQQQYNAYLNHNNPQYFSPHYFRQQYTPEQLERIFASMTVAKPVAPKVDARRAKLLNVTKENGYCDAECETAKRLLGQKE